MSRQDELKQKVRAAGAKKKICSIYKGKEGMNEWVRWERMWEDIFILLSKEVLSP
jgi:hypothetical protein